VNVLVTGGTGYLGRNFISACRENYQFQKFSLLTDRLENLYLKNVDTILHCAALVHQKKKCSYQAYYDANVLYPLNLALEAKANGVKHFVFISTVAVYGDEHALVSEDTRCKPITPYARTKRKAEIELLKLTDENFAVSIIRSPLIYGFDAPGNMASLMKITDVFCILPLADADNKRTFVYIDNLIRVIDEVIQARKAGIFLAADDASVSTSRLIELISREQGKKTMLVKLPLFKAMLKMIAPKVYASLYGNLELNNKATKEALCFSNPVDLEEGIRRTLHHNNRVVLSRL